MNKEDYNLSRRSFLKTLGMGVGSAAAMSVAPITGIAQPLKKNAATQPTGATQDAVGMTYRINRHTKDKVSLLGYGMMRLPRKGNEVDQEMVNQEVDYAIAHGINYFDTAPAYGNSEVCTGIALKRHPRQSFYLATKMSNQREEYWDLEKAKEMYRNSFKRLQVDYFDYYLLHSIGGGGVPNLKKRFIDNKLIDFLCAERDAGRIRNLGFSYHGDVKAFDWLVDHTKEYGFTFVQIEMNYIDWRHAKNGHKIDADAEYLYNKCERAGLQCVVMEPLLGGRLARVPDEVAQELKAQRPDDTPARWAFRWVGSHQNILTTLSGMTTMEVLKENVETFSPLDPCTTTEFNLLARVADQMLGVPVIPCTACRYCVPCPYGVSIPENFAFYNNCVNEKTVPNDKTAPDYEQKLAAFQQAYAKAIPEKGSAMNCVDCEACLPKCPQSIRIPNQMARLVELLPSID